MVIIFTDFSMPVKNGVQAIQEVKAGHLQRQSSAAKRSSGTNLHADILYVYYLQRLGFYELPQNQPHSAEEILKIIVEAKTQVKNKGRKYKK